MDVRIVGAVKLLDDEVTVAEAFVKGVVLLAEIEVVNVGEEPLLAANHGETWGGGRASERLSVFPLTLDMEVKAGVVGYTYGSTAPDGLVSLVRGIPLCRFLRQRTNSEIPAIKLANTRPPTRPAMRGVDDELYAPPSLLDVDVWSSTV